MAGATTRVFVSRLSGLAVFDPSGDQVGRVRDAVATLRPADEVTRVIGLLVEVAPRRQIFVPMSRITSMDRGQVITTGVVNLRRFEQRGDETLVIAEFLDRKVRLIATGEEVTVIDIGMEQARGRDWVVAKVHVRKGGGKLRRRGETLTVAWDQVEGLAAGEEAAQGAANLLATFEKLRPADLANVMHDLSPKRRHEMASALDVDRLADVLEELSEEDQVEILGQLDDEKAADVLEAMQPDDAADLLGDLPEPRGPEAARADGAGRGRPGAPAAELRRPQRRRPDDHRAGDPAAERHGGRGAGPDPQPRPDARRWPR